MRRSRANLKDSRLETEKRRTFKGSALINLDVLHFSSDEHRDLDPKHVEYLKECFQKDRCRRFEEQNHIQAIIDQPNLDDVLRHSDVSPYELLNSKRNGCPKLIFPRGFKLRCLHGQHRIAAAREFLLPHDKLWTIDLYTSDLDDNLKRCLHEQYLNEQKPSDGEAYCKIRYYHFQRDLESENQWKARLRGCRLKNLKELLVDADLTAGFDDLLDIPGLWDGMRMTTLQSMMAMGCKDEILHYLACIKQGLLALVGGDKQALAKLDQATVKALELRAPGASTVDAQFLRTQIRGGAIFTAFTSHERDQILDRLPMVNGMILTLFSFFKDLNYLHLLIDCLQRLVNVSRRESVCEAIQRRYTGVNQRDEQVKIQVTEEAFIYKTGTDAAQIDLGYRSLIALAMRYYPYMPRDRIREDTVMKATTKADQAILGRLAELAYQQGFETPQILTLREYSSARVTSDDDPPFPPLDVTSGRGVDLRRRSGIPRRRVYEEDRYSLFINYLHDTKMSQGEGITSFFVRKHVYLAFFGGPPTDDGTTIYSSPSSRSGSDSPQCSIGASFSREPRHDISQSQGASEPCDEDINDIIYSNNHGEHIPEQERLERDSLELRKLEETIERDDLNERFTQRLQAQENLDQEKQREQEQRRREQERGEEDKRRQETRQQRRREEEEQVYGRTLRDHERNERRHTLLDIESIDNATRETASSEPQSGRELVMADQSPHFVRRLRNPVVDLSSVKSMVGQERREQEIRDQERMEREAEERERQERERQEREMQERSAEERERQERERQEREMQERSAEELERERLELRRIEESLEREDLQERFAQRLQAQESLNREKQREQEEKRRKQEREDEEQLRQEARQRRRLEEERRVHGRTLRSSERTKRPHTQINMGSVYMHETTESGLRSGRELVPVNQNQGSSYYNINPTVDQSARSQKDTEQEKERSELEGKRLEDERLEEERLEREGLEHERLEQERLEDEALEERLEQERLEQERLEQERLEQERLRGLERLEILRRLEQEREKRRLEHEKLGWQNREQDMQTAQIKQRKNGRLEQQKTTESEVDLPEQITPSRPRREQDPTPLGQTRDPVCITFMVRERGVWRTTQSIQVPPLDQSKIERVAVKYMWKGMRLYDIDLNSLTPQMCFQAAIAKGTNLLLLIPKKEIDINEELEASVSQLVSELGLQEQH